MICKFCGEDKKLIDAHIIPEGFFRRVRRGKQSLKMVTNMKGQFPRKSPIGEYDRTIVCGDCEGIWQDWDDYAQKLLGDTPTNSWIRYGDNKKLCYVVDNYDYSRLKLFFISLLWRASVSSRPFYSKVSLGEFEAIAKKHIEEQNPGGTDDFAVTIAKFDHPSAKSMLDPHSDKFFGVNFCRFYLTDYVAYIKVDHSPSPYLFSQLSIAEGRPLHVICRDFTASKELLLMKGLASRL
jgi:hypothetical protein